MLGFFFIFAIIYSIGAACFDLKTRKIPNQYNLIVFLLTLTLKIILAAIYGWGILSDALLGMLIGFAIFFPVFVLRLAGAGDVKLLSILGLMLGPQHFLWVFILTSVFDFLILICSYLKIAYLMILEPIPLELKKESFTLYMRNKRSVKNPYAFPVAFGVFSVYLMYLYQVLPSFSILWPF